jgi:hypothetical protein
MLRVRNRLGLGFIEPCLPSPAKVPPSGPDWIHEIKDDGFRIGARFSGKQLSHSRFSTDDYILAWGSQEKLTDR